MRTGVWKLYNSLLTNSEFCKGIKEKIEQVYANCERSHLTNSDKWDLIKSKCQDYAKEYSKNKSKTNAELLNNLYRLDYELKHQNLETDNFELELETKEQATQQIKLKIEELESAKMQGTAFRCHYKWEKEGDSKMTKYFFALEKRNYNNKTMFTILLKDGTICSEQKHILAEQRKLYEELYTMNPNISFNIQNTTKIRLTEMQKSELDLEITIEECTRALNELKNNKVPGCDGLSKEFYCTMWDMLECPFWNMVKEIIVSKILNQSSRKGLISLIPKKGKDPRIIKNLRPLTLLNTDYKIIAKTLANRLKKVLPELIGPQQTGFMTG